MNDNKIKNVDDLIYSLLNTPVSANKGYYCFRGQVNHSWPVLPKLLRHEREKSLTFERALLKPFLTNPRSIPYLKTNDPIEYFMILQHFGISTRLLDCTLDPLISLFFACYDPAEEYTNKDGIMLLYPIEQYDKLPIHSPEHEKYKKKITKDKIRERLIQDKHLYFEPLIKNAKMRAQDGSFFFFSTFPINRNENQFVSMERFHQERNRHLKMRNAEYGEDNHLLWFAHKIIDQSFKSSILKELDDNYGINKETMLLNHPRINEYQRFFDDLYEDSLKEMKRLKDKLPKEDLR